MPRPPKPVHLRQNTERLDVGLVLMPTEAPPPAPAGLLKAWADQWEVFWRSSVAGAARRDSDMPAITRLFLMYDERERLAKAVKNSRVVKGSMGQMVANPLLNQINTLDGKILALEDRLGLSPLSRLKLGVVLGDAVRSMADLNAEIDSDQDRDDPRLTVIHDARA